MCDEAIPPALIVKARHLPWQTPLIWLQRGWQDICRAPCASLFYGGAFVVMGYVLGWLFSYAPEHTITLATAFLLVGPFVAIGLYDISRRGEQQARIRLTDTLTAWRRNLPGISLFAMLLTLLVAGWMRVSVVIIALFFTQSFPSLDKWLSADWFMLDNALFLLVYFGIGSVFAALVFMISVVSIPIMLDRDYDTLSAIFASVNVALKNPLCMFIWAGLIVLLTLIGFATFYLGLWLTIPLIGHATWHAYRSLITHQPLTDSATGTQKAST